MSKIPNFYQILGVSKDATDEEIKRSYRKLAQLYHPDKNNSEEATDKFQQINTAYHVLIDPQKRRHYDLSDGNDLPISNVGVNVWSFLNDYFANNRIDMIVKVTYEQLIWGGELDINYEETVLIDEGGKPAKKIKCPSCGNRGGLKFMGIICMACGNQGEIYPIGTRSKLVSKNIHLVIPIKSWVGRILKVDGKAFKLDVPKTEKLFHQGSDLIFIKNLNVFEALLGFDQELSIVNKIYRVTYPKPIQPGSEVKLENYGLWASDGRRGDLIVRFSVDFPEKLTDRQKRHVERCLKKVK